MNCPTAADDAPDRDLDPPDLPDWKPGEYESFIYLKALELLESPEWTEIAPDALVDHPEDYYQELGSALVDEDALEVGRIAMDGVMTWIKTYLESRY